jgi:hypothetical protein
LIVFGQREHLSATTALSQMTHWGCSVTDYAAKLATDVLYQRIPEAVEAIRQPSR